MEERRQLHGWDEIALYLGVKRRAAQKYEAEHGLVIHRLPGERGRVFAYADELDEWLRTSAGRRAGQEARGVNEESRESEPIVAVMSEDATETAEESTHHTPSNRPAVRLMGWFSALLGGTALAVWWLSSSPGNPITFKENGRLLQVFGTHSELLWESILPEEPMPLAQKPTPYTRGLFSDLDGDGLNELLFVFLPLKATENGSFLYCFRPDGRLAWKAKPGRPMTTTTGQPLGASYQILQVGVLKVPRRDGGRIVVSSRHAWSGMHQVMLLTSSGEKVAEYWHPGWLFKMTIVDLNEDGIEEIVLGGVNDGYRDNTKDYAATLVILDSRRIDGQGVIPERGSLRLQNVKIGSEAAIILFPNFLPVWPEPSAYCFVNAVRFVDGHLEVQVDREAEQSHPAMPQVLYQLNRRFEVVGVTPNVHFTSRLSDSRVASSTRRTVSKTDELRAIKVLRNELTR